MYGILCGLAAEAKIAQQARNAIVLQTASCAEHGPSLARALVDRGATFLVSFGLCGALSPELRAGDCLIGNAIKSDTATYYTDEKLQATLKRAMPHAFIGPLCSSQKIVVSSLEKEMLFAKTGALGVDMESLAIAQVAADCRLPFAIVRAVSDDVHTTLPPAALLPLREDGAPDLAAIIRDVFRNPSQIPALIRLGHNTGKAMKTLKRAAKAFRE